MLHRLASTNERFGGQSFAHDRGRRQEERRDLLLPLAFGELTDLWAWRIFPELMIKRAPRTHNDALVLFLNGGGDGRQREFAGTRLLVLLPVIILYYPLIIELVIFPPRATPEFHYRSNKITVTKFMR
jgi:hypothetical protein